MPFTPAEKRAYYAANVEARDIMNDQSLKSHCRLRENPEYREKERLAGRARYARKKALREACRNGTCLEATGYVTARG